MTTLLRIRYAAAQKWKTRKRMKVEERLLDDASAGAANEANEVQALADENQQFRKV